MTYVNGESYDGNWVQDRREGAGIYLNADGTIRK